ncbi:MAG: hypothetical protein KJZ65_05640 [Phycisphaerales bacterium]|nr:hypothetical protein [Phycisphaerales bacterium]
MLRCMMVVCGFGAAASGALAQYQFAGYGASFWQRADSVIGVAGYVIEDFEDLTLADGLRISIIAIDGSFGPSGTLPNVFHPVTDDPFGDVFDTSVWDGTASLLNTYNNQSAVYTFADHWNSIMKFHFDPGVRSVGFSVQQMQLSSTLVINGQVLGALHTRAGLPLSSGRMGYIRIDACGGVIREVEIRSQNADGWAIDHLAFKPAPGSCFGDFNHDCSLDFFDVQAFLNAFADLDPTADLNVDGVWNFFDVQKFLNDFAAGC